MAPNHLFGLIFKRQSQGPCMKTENPIRSNDLLKTLMTKLTLGRFELTKEGLDSCTPLLHVQNRDQIQRRNNGKVTLQPFPYTQDKED